MASSSVGNHAFISSWTQPDRLALALPQLLLYSLSMPDCSAARRRLRYQRRGIVSNRKIRNIKQTHPMIALSKRPLYPAEPITTHQ